MRVVPVERRTPVLKAPAFGCLRGVPAVNLTAGCLHRCTYCYARAFPGVAEDEVRLYANLAARLRRELEARARRGRLPAVVTFSTASDLFQPHPAVLALAREALALLLDRGVAVSFLTKGRLPEEVWALIAAHRDLVHPRFGLVSLSPDYARLFEPRAAHPFLRLRQIERCAALGLAPAVRVDPVIPLVTDRPESVDSLFRHLASCGVREVSVSYLVLRPGVARQMARELPRPLFARISRAYRGQPWQRVITSATTRLVRPELRERGYALFREAGNAWGLRVRVCGCKNPDLPFEPCSPWETAPRPRQRSLFGEEQLVKNL